MKKISKILSSIAFVFVLLLSSTLFVACANKDEDSKPVDVRNSRYKIASEGHFIEWIGDVTTSEKIGFLELMNDVEYNGIYGNEESENQFITEQENEFINMYTEAAVSITFNQDGTVYLTTEDDECSGTAIATYLQSEDLKTINIYYGGELMTSIKYKNHQYYIVSDYPLSDDVIGENKSISINLAFSYVDAGSYYGEPTVAYSVKNSYFVHKETGLKLTWSYDTTAEDKQTVYSTFDVSNAMELASKMEENLESWGFYINFDYESNGVADLFADERYYYTQSTDLKTIKFYEDVDHIELVEMYSLEFDNNQFWFNLKYSDKLTIKILLTRVSFDIYK